ncbi:MarR family transcriptional regulator [Leucobacter sp. CSA2]|uniref:MarR family transcriptional regulator n=2 Tax=Leucobacter edaphi TaxID=2796472 RepID=A0A934QCH9_9MICO|nr:MarR family transcriptional regulator [Leucobacter edaphi]MBK0421678.1 MarR family transcriptional regulator [Leucobacter edaphi]
MAGLAVGSHYSSVAWRTLAALDAARNGARDAGSSSAPGSNAPAGLRVSEIARLQRVAQPSATSLVNRLEGDGWVRRDPDPADGRASLVTITDAGARALADYRASVATRLSPMIAALPPRDRSALARAAELLADFAEQLEGGAAVP